MSAVVPEEDRERVVGSLETILQTFLGDKLETIRQSVRDLAAETAQHIAGLREETRGSLEALRSELVSNDESVKQEAVNTVEARIQSTTEHFGSRLENSKRDLDRRLEDVASRLQNEHLTLSERLDSVERGLTGHEAVSGRIREVLDTLGSILSRESAVQVPGTVSPPATQVAFDDPNADHDGIESEVKVMLTSSAPQSEVETQPLAVGNPDLTDTEEVEGALNRVALAPPERHGHHGPE